MATADDKVGMSFFSSCSALIKCLSSRQHFYRKAVLAIANPFVRPSVCLSVKHVNFQIRSNIFVTQKAECDITL